MSGIAGSEVRVRCGYKERVGRERPGSSVLRQSGGDDERSELDEKVKEQKNFR